MAPRPKRRRSAPAPVFPCLEPAEREEFRTAVADVRVRPPVPLPPRPPAPQAEAHHSRADELAVLADLDKAIDGESFWFNGDQWSYLRPGLPDRLLRDLRRGRLRIQGDLDLHGYRVDEAREAVNQFLHHARQQRWTCVRIVHGKGLGSPGQVPVLKRLVGLWLQRQGHVLAFTQARPAEGGGGALRVLLGEQRR